MDGGVANCKNRPAQFAGTRHRKILINALYKLSNFMKNIIISDRPHWVRAGIIRTAQVLVCGLGLAAAPSGQATSSDIVVKAVAEVMTKSTQDGAATLKLAPATRVVPGDEVIYTLEVRNTGVTSVRAPKVTYAVPAHMVYIADSATGPGADVSYSADGGQTFDQPENLRVLDADGHERSAIASDYTHIRWKLKRILKSNSVAFTRFHAVVK
jgi:uncharacterized repeat protein (TIGR01451 family)